MQDQQKKGENMNETNELGMQIIDGIPVFGDPVDQRS
jgi:hypothetical protein